MNYIYIQKSTRAHIILNVYIDGYENKYGTVLIYMNMVGIKMSLDARKPVFGGLRTTQAQTSLRIRAD